MELEAQINQLVDTIDTIIRSILEGKEVEPVKLFPVMIEQFGIVLPEIVKREEASADLWMQLLQRVSAALETDDRFLIMDVLFYETRGSLLQYKGEAC